MVRGHWVVERYFGAEGSALENGWFATGDVATIDADGYMQITDRSKDVIKSGGNGSRRSSWRTSPFRIPRSSSPPASPPRIRSGTSARC